MRLKQVFVSFLVMATPGESRYVSEDTRGFEAREVVLTDGVLSLTCENGTYVIPLTSIKYYRVDE